MNTEIRALLQLFENKLASFWQLDGQLHECVDDDRAYKLESRQRVLEREVDAIREQLVSKIGEISSAD